MVKRAVGFIRCGVFKHDVACYAVVDFDIALDLNGAIVIPNVCDAFAIDVTLYCDGYNVVVCSIFFLCYGSSCCPCYICGISS